MIILHQIKFHCIECRHYFIRVDGKRISNNPMESLIGKLKRLLDDRYGYSNFNRFRNRIMFCSNKNEPIKINNQSFKRLY